MVNTVWVNADRGNDFHPIVDHITFSLQLMLNQTICNFIVCLMISQKLHKNIAQKS